MTRRASTDTPQIIMGAIGGVVTGYILWLAAISVGDGLTTVSQWSRVVLLLSVLLAELQPTDPDVAQPRVADEAEQHAKKSG